MSTRPRSPLAAAALLGLAAIATSVMTAPETPQPPSAQVLGQAVASGLGGEGSCDVDGVTVAYETDYRSTPDAAAYRVTSATVDDIAPTCQGATLQVELLDGTEPIATGSAIVGTDASSSVDLIPAGPAEAVDGVRVEIAGGSVPVPSECAQMRLDTVRVGTTGPDVLPATNDRDLAFGLDGNDEMAGGNLNDCLDGGPGDDQLDAGTHDDVVLGGTGNDTLTGDVGKDELYGGSGDDTLDGGQGNDHLDGGDGHDRCTGGQGKNTFAGCEVKIP